MVISAYLILCFCGCKNSLNRTIVDPKIKMFRDRQTLVFCRITDGKDTCLVGGFLDSFYDRLNIKDLNQESFDANYSTKILHNEVIDVSEECYRNEQPSCITPIDTISKLYNNWGIYNFLYYMEKYPINQLFKEDIDSFIWASYLLWQNGVYVSLSEEENYWYINYDK